MRRNALSIVLLFAILFTVQAEARESRTARPKNLYNLVDGRVLTIYLNNISSATDKISATQFKEVLKNYLQARIKERFEITEAKESSEACIDVKINKYQYLEKDPIDQISGGWSGLLVDAAIDQNYARIDVDIAVIRTKDNKTLWHRDFYSTVTKSDMPEQDSIPKVIQQSCKQFVFMCFGKSKR